MDNPYLRKEYNKINLLPQTTSPHKLYDKGGGSVGNISSTFNKSTLGSFSAGNWVGEEFELLKGKIPVFYSAFCENNVKALRIEKAKFHEKLPREVLNAMEKVAY